MSSPYYQFTDRRRAGVHGEFTAKTADELMRGLLAKINTGSDAGTLTVATASDNPDGVVDDNRFNVYAPTSEYAAADEQVALLDGNIVAICDANYFASGSLPSVGDTLYSAAGGKMATSGTYKIGKAYAADDRRYPPNTTANVIKVVLNLGGKDATFTAP